jgi:hypothetical protein
LIGILMRPVAIVFGFVFSFFIINIAMWFASVGLSIFISGMLTDVVMGPISMFATFSVILGVIFMLLRYVLRMVTHLPENIPNWMGGRGNNVGEMQAAEGGNQAMEGGAKTVARGGFAVKQGSDARTEKRLADAVTKKEKDARAASFKASHTPPAAEGKVEKTGGNAKP